MVTEPWEIAATYFKSYALPRAGWAWEFTRRHPGYQSDFNAARQGAASADRAAKWGLLLFEDPRVHARDALVLWQPDAQPGMLRVVPRRGLTSTGAIDVWTEPARKAIALTPAGLVLLLERDGEQFRFRFEDPNLGGNPIAFDLRIGAPPEGQVEIEVARAFLRTFLPNRAQRSEIDPLAPKLARYLQALDARLARASYERIGQALFPGDAALDTEAGRLLIKGRVRHAVRRGFELMNGGYRRLLPPAPV